MRNVNQIRGDTIFSLTKIQIQQAIFKCISNDSKQLKHYMQFEQKQSQFVAI